MGRRLYVGNLNYVVSSPDLEQLFSPFGTVVNARVIQDRESENSKGFGFVEMESDAEADAAIEALHEQDHEGRSLKVNEARPRENRSSRGASYTGGPESHLIARY